MGDCVKCGKFAGLGSTKHEWDCLGTEVGAVAVPLTETDVLVLKLRPVLMKAATRAGIAAALTFAAISFVVGIVVAVVHSL